MDCEFCKKTFSSKSNLNLHKKTARYCIELQGKTIDEQFECKFCNKSFSQKGSVEDHYNICKERSKQQIEQKQNEYILTIKNLENEIAKWKKNEKKDKDSKKIIQEKTQCISNLEEKIKEKNEYIAKLEAKLEKFENACINASKNKSIDDDLVSLKSSSTNQP